MTATSTAASSLPPVRTSCHVPLSLMTSISEETISLWLKLGALEKLEQAVLDGYGDQLCGKTSRIPQVNKFLKQVPLFQNKIREIHQAVSQGRLRDVQHLIDRKKLAFCRDHNGASPLHKAVIFGHQDVIEYLVKRYAGSIHIRDHQGRTALHYAAFLPDRGEIYQYLLANGADERAMDVYGRQPSYYLDGQNESTLRQLRDGSTLNGLRKIKPRYYGQVSAGQPFTNTNISVLGTTATKSQIRELISDGNINALEDLVLQGQGDRLLGEISSVPKIQSFLNIVPMYMERIYDVHRAVMRDQLEHVVILLENKKLAMARDQLGATPLHKAVLFGHYKIAHYISHQFPDTLNAIDLEGRTALHYAAALKDNKNMYGILIEAGANKGIYDNKGKTADYYAQYPEHLNLEEVIKRCHKVNANYLANTASRIKGKSPVRQTPPPSNGNLSSPRSEENNSSSKDTSQSNDSGNENELISLLQKDKNSKRLDMSSANIRRWVNAKDVEKLTKAVMEGYSEKVVRVNTNEDYEDKEQITGKITEMVDRINAIHSAVSSDDLTELQNQLEERDFALAKDHVGNTPLHKSVLLRKAKIVAYLIEKFPETINAKNKSGLTPLHYAAAMSRKDGLQLYKMLLQAGADPKIRDSHGRTPDYYKTHLITLPNKGMMRTRPAGGRHSETLNRYSKQGVLERMTTALQKGDVELLQDLVLEGHGKHLFGKTSWNEDVKTFLKELPSYLNKIQLLHESIKSGDVEKVKELVASNEKLMRARDESGALPMHIAVSSDSFEVLEFFVKNYPSAINVKDCTGKTALHIASQKGNVGLCKMLKQAGADPKILDQKGKTADFYLQNAKHDGVKMDYDSSKSMLNSSSESSSSIVNAANVRRKSSKDVKSEALVEKTDESVEVAVENEKSLNNDESTESTEAEKEIGENSEERKESLTAAETKDTNENEESEDHATEDQDGEDSNENQTDINLEDEENKEVTTEIDTDADGENVASNETEKSEIESEVPQTSNEDEETAVETEVEQPESEQNEKEDETAETNEIKEDTEINENTRENEEAVPDDENEESQDEQLEIAEAAEDKSEEADENVGNEDGKDDNEGIETTEEDKAETDPTEVNEGAEKVEAEEEENYSEEKTDETNAEDTPEDGEVTNKINEDESAEAAEETNENAENSEPNPEESVNEAPNENNDEKSNVENSAEGVTIADVGSGNTENDNEEKQQNVNENEEENPAESNPEEDTKNSNEDEDEKKEDENETKENETEKEPSKDDVIEENQIEAHESEEKENDEGNVNEKDETSEIKEVEENENDAVEESKDNTTDENKDSDGKENTDSTSKEAEESKDETPQEEIKQVEQDIENAEDSITKSSTQDEPAHHTKDHLDELIEHWIKEGDLLRLEHVVLAGQGDRLIERTSEDKQVQDFLDLVPIYMAKIRAVHEAVAKGQLREVRSVLTRKRFALSRDHVGASPLHLAALHGHTDVSSYIISHFPETMDGPDNEGRTPLHYATALGDNGTLYRLLKTAGADENIEDKAGHSPKYYMSNPGQLTLETLLLPYSTNE